MTSAMTLNPAFGIRQVSTIDRPVPVSQFIWAPTGDKLLYLTTAGDLFWSHPDGSNASLLTHYAEIADQLEEQMPLTNTLLVRHLGPSLPNGDRGASHLDVIRFTPGQPPRLQPGPDLANLPVHIRWWSPTRASGIAHTGRDGGDLLVTVDQDGNMVSEVNVPYMLAGVVRPGGGWLAYATTYQVTQPLDGSSPEAVYLLNLDTSQRLQVTPAGSGGWVGDWSPDGQWLLMSSGGAVALVSADGRQWITIPADTISVSAVWSPDSRYLADAVVQGATSDGHTISSWTGAVHIVNVPARQVSHAWPGAGAKAGAGSNLLWQPKWSRDSKTVSFLSFNPDCGSCSHLRPAIVHMAP